METKLPQYNEMQKEFMVEFENIMHISHRNQLRQLYLYCYKHDLDASYINSSQKLLSQNLSWDDLETNPAFSRKRYDSISECKSKYPNHIEFYLRVLSFLTPRDQALDYQFRTSASAQPSSLRTFFIQLLKQYWDNESDQETKENIYRMLEERSVITPTKSPEAKHLARKLAVHKLIDSLI